MAFSDTSKINISLKKLQGKAHTSNDKSLANEGLSSGITQASSTIFGEAVPTSPTTTNLYDRSGSGTFQVELVRFECEFISGTDTAAGRHAFRLKLPAGYEAGSSHGPAGAYLNSAILNSSNGTLQLVPPSFANAYEAKPFYGGSATKNSGTQIPLLDSRDWNIDYFNGVLFQQDPPGAGDHANNPDFVEAFLYIGKYLSTVVAAAGGGSPGGSNTQIQFNDSSAFAGDTNLTFNRTTDTLSTVNLTGSLTQLTDGSSYLIAGSNVTIVTGSTGAITIASSAAGGASNTFSTLSIAGQDDITADTATDTLTLAAGANVTLTTDASSDTITIASTGGGETNTSSNLGTGTGIFAQKSSLDFQFKSIKAGNNISLSSDSTSITIASNSTANVVSGLKKFVKKLESVSSAGTALTFSDLSLGTALNTSGSVDLFYNGQLLISGSQTTVGAGTADYYADSSNSFKFGFNLETDDVVTVKQTQLADITGEEYFILSSDKPALPNVRVLTAGDGISISTANPREIAVSANRSKKFFDITGSHAISQPYDCHSMNFASANYSPDRIDVFLNGQSLRTGSNQDYLLQPTGSILFNMGLEVDDIVQVVIF